MQVKLVKNIPSELDSKIELSKRFAVLQKVIRAKYQKLRVMDGSNKVIKRMNELAKLDALTYELGKLPFNPYHTFYGLGLADALRTSRQRYESAIGPNFESPLGN